MSSDHLSRSLLTLNSKWKMCLSRNRDQTLKLLDSNSKCETLKMICTLLTLDSKKLKLDMRLFIIRCEKERKTPSSLTVLSELKEKLKRKSMRNNE